MLGLAKEIKVKQIQSDNIESTVNRALTKLDNCPVLDIKFSKSATEGAWGADVLIVYKDIKQEDDLRLLWESAYNEEELHTKNPQIYNIGKREIMDWILENFTVVGVNG